MSFHIDWSATFGALFLAALLWLVSRWRRKRERPRLRFSRMGDLKAVSDPQKSYVSSLPGALIWVALGLFLVALCDPHLRVERDRDQGSRLAEQSRSDDAPERTRLPTEGIGVYLVLDVSGSMQDSSSSIDRASRNRRRIDLLKDVTRKFVVGDPEEGLPGRWSDMLGLITFARAAQLEVPLTLDHNTLLEKLRAIDVVSNRNQDGTAIGYAVYKTVALIDAARQYAASDQDAPAYEMFHTAMVLVTDGLHRPHPEDFQHPLRSISPEKAGAFAAEHGVRLYVVNIEPAIRLKEYTKEREQLQKMADATGGEFFIATAQRSLESIYRSIDRIEKQRLPGQLDIEATFTDSQAPDAWKLHAYKVPLAPYLIAIGLCLLAASVVLRTTVMKVVP